MAIMARNRQQAGKHSAGAVACMLKQQSQSREKVREEAGSKRKK